MKYTFTFRLGYMMGELLVIHWQEKQNLSWSFGTFRPRISTPVRAWRICYPQLLECPSKNGTA